MYDVLIIGCGITGAAMAFELSRYKLNIAVLENETDVATGTTKANSAILSWPIISPVVRLRLNPCLPVEQKRQLTAQPACVDTHSVPRPSSGMNTVSTALPCPTSSNHLRVPSSEVLSLITVGSEITARPVSFSRSDFAKSVIASKSLTPKT